MIDISKMIAKSLEEYTTEVVKGIDEDAERVAEETVKELQASSPRRKGGSGDYAKSWAKKRNEKGKWVVYNKDHYRLTHLLEKGHAKRNGGRVAPQVHIKPVEEKVIADFEEAVEKRIGG